MENRNREREFLAEINVIPLVDVVLVLLIIFMITAPLLYRGIDVTLPRSQSTTIQPTGRAVLTVVGLEEIYVDKDLVGLGQVRSVLEQRKAMTPSLTVYLRAGRDLPYGLIIQVMDEVKKAGIDRAGLVTEPPPPRRPKS